MVFTSGHSSAIVLSACSLGARMGYSLKPTNHNKKLYVSKKSKLSTQACGVNVALL